MTQNTIKMPWERRLKDLSILLNNCASTYYEPDLFRMNTNQFLQTARTVTFIIQKNKSSIHGFDTWYNESVVEPWSKDEVMTWAKDSRNTIEKMGDLEINSKLEASLVFSYLDNEDIVLNVGKIELLQYGIKKLIRYAQKHLPSGVSRDTILRVSRTWVTSSLSNWELFHALVYVYTKHYETHITLCNKINTNPEINLLDPASANSIRELALNPKYLKLRNFKDYSARLERVKLDPNYAPPPELEEKFIELRENSQKIDSLDSAISHYLEFARVVFSNDEYHIPILHLFDKDWKVVYQTSTMFEDQSEKYLFWRSIGDRVKSQNIHALVWVSELWHRNMKGYPKKPINELEITGEGLMVAGLDSTGHFKQGSWEIHREKNGEHPKLSNEPSFSDDADGHVPFFFAPAGKAMGGDAAILFDNS